MKKNLAAGVRENWPPPLLNSVATRRGRAVARVRRFFDLQAGSIWRDVATELKSVKGRLLDVGCGVQPFRPLVPADVSYVGIDIDAAEEKFGYRAPDTRYYTGGAWPVDSGSVDFILCTETLEHVLEPASFLAEAHRSLKNGARIFISVPFSARWHFIPYDYWRYTPSGLMHLLTKAGFSDVRIYARGNALTVACYKCMAVVLPLLLPRKKPVLMRVPLFFAGLLCLPGFIACAVLANISFYFESGDDCLGYSAVATKIQDG